MAVYAGRRSQGTDEDIMGSGSAQEVIDTPSNRIRAITTVVLTVSERIEWRDDLF